MEYLTNEGHHRGKCIQWQGMDYLPPSIPHPVEGESKGNIGYYQKQILGV